MEGLIIFYVVVSWLAMAGWSWHVIEEKGYYSGWIPILALLFPLPTMLGAIGLPDRSSGEEEAG